VNEDHIPIFVRRRLEHYPLEYDVSPDFAIYYGFPLLRRAWVYQELLLAPRVLYFSPQELIWECDEGLYCECGSADQNSASRKLKLERAFADSSIASIAAQWRQSIREYSPKKLSVPSLRLPALSGIARRYQNFDPIPIWRGSGEDH
jgi:hypothetical protein